MKFSKIFKILAAVFFCLLIIGAFSAYKNLSKKTSSPISIKETTTETKTPAQAIPTAEPQKTESVQQEEPSYEAEPLPNSVNAGGLNIALHSIERSEDETEPKFLIRKISSSGDFDSSFEFALVDDHGNVYDERKTTSRDICFIGPGFGISSDYVRRYRSNKISALPVGFTWTEQFCDFNVPLTAPLVEARIKYSESGELKQAVLNIADFQPSQFDDFYSQLKEADSISLPYKISVSEYLTATIQKFKRGQHKGKDVFILPVYAENTDYSGANLGFGPVGIQIENGMVMWDYYSGFGMPPTIPGSSKQTHEAILPPECTDKCRALIFVKFPGRDSNRYTILKITPENFE